MSPLTQPCRAIPGVVVTLQCRVRAAGRKVRTPPIQRALHVYEREAVANAGRVATQTLVKDELGDKTEDGRSAGDVSRKKGCESDSPVEPHCEAHAVPFYCAPPPTPTYGPLMKRV